MALVKHFEELHCCQQARILVKQVYQVTAGGNFSKDYGVKDQIRRAALSSMSNIAEGFGRFSNKEFIRYLEISSASALEVKSILYVALDLEYLPKQQVQSLHQLTEDVRSLDQGLIRYLKTRQKPNNPKP